MISVGSRTGRCKCSEQSGCHVCKGGGVIQDNVMAQMWLNIAASSGSADGVKNRDLVAKHLTAAEISKAQQLARECVARNYKGC